MLGDILPDDTWPADGAPEEDVAEENARAMFEALGVKYRHTSAAHSHCLYDFITYIDDDEYRIDVKGSKRFVGRVLVDQFTPSTSGYFERRASMRHNYYVLLNNNVIVSLEEAYIAKKPQEVCRRNKMTWTIDYRDFAAAGVTLRSFKEWLEEKRGNSN